MSACSFLNRSESSEAVQVPAKSSLTGWRASALGTYSWACRLICAVGGLQWSPWALWECGWTLAFLTNKCCIRRVLCEQKCKCWELGFQIARNSCTYLQLLKIITFLVSAQNNMFIMTFSLIMCSLLPASHTSPLQHCHQLKISGATSIAKTKNHFCRPSPCLMADTS